MRGGTIEFQERHTRVVNEKKNKTDERGAIQGCSCWTLRSTITSTFINCFNVMRKQNVEQNTYSFFFRLALQLRRLELVKYD